MCHMPAVCEEKGLPYVYTPSRWLIRPSLQLLLSSFLQTGPGHCHGGQAGMPDDDGQCHVSTWAAFMVFVLEILVASSRCENTRTTRSFMMRSRQRSRPFPRQFSAENLDLFLWQIMYFSLQTARICDLCCFCSVATNAKNVIVAATNCYCNHEKSAQPQFFFSCNSVVVVFTWPHPPALDLSSI